MLSLISEQVGAFMQRTRLSSALSLTVLSPGDAELLPIVSCSLWPHPLTFSMAYISGTFQGFICLVHCIYPFPPS